MNTKVIIILAIIILISLIFYFSNTLERKYQEEIKYGLNETENINKKIITEKDLENLPEAVKKYLSYVGVVGKEEIKNYKLMIDGQMKMDRNKEFQKVEIEQYSFQESLTSLFYMEMKIGGLPIKGLHSYVKDEAIMDIRLLGLIPVAKGEGDKMNEAETVTIFNDMCLFAPATLIDERIEWEELDSKTVKAFFTRRNITIEATLYFNEKNQLINFESNNRYYSPKGDTFKNIKWSTPIYEYSNFNGYNLPSSGEAFWSFEDEDFTYIKLNINSIEYNI